MRIGDWKKEGEGLLICMVNAGGLVRYQAFAIDGISVMSAVISMS
jgi:hypothetical protein